MKIKEDFVLRKVADSYVVVPVNKLTLDTFIQKLREADVLE